MTPPHRFPWWRRAALVTLAAGATVAPAAAAPSPFYSPVLNRLAFSTPDGSAGCVMGFNGAPGVVCDSSTGAGARREPDERPGTPPVPPSCMLGWGVRYVLPTRGEPRGECSSTWIGAGHRVLPRNRTLRMGGGIRCRSLVRGVRCVNRAGRGFVLTPQRVRLF